jgi:hypothetical protein
MFGNVSCISHVRRDLLGRRKECTETESNKSKEKYRKCLQISHVITRKARKDHLATRLQCIMIINADPILGWLREIDEVVNFNNAYSEDCNGIK